MQTKIKIMVWFLCLIYILLSNSVWANQSIAISEPVLRERFANFSTAGSFVLIKIQDVSSRESSAIVCENTEWFDALVTMPEYAGFTDKQYTDLMIRKYNQTFVVAAALYKKLSVAHAAPLNEKFDKIKTREMQYIADTYLQKKYWDASKNNYVYLIKNTNTDDARSLLRMFLEMGFVVRRDCESGEIYIAPGEIDVRLKGK